MCVHRGTYWDVDVAARRLSHASADPRLLAAMLREVEALAVARHPHIVLFLAASVTDHDCTIVTEFFHGGSLDDRLRSCRRPPPRRDVARWALALMKAVTYLH
jgi:serine/threonine protein kinase